MSDPGVYVKICGVTSVDEAKTAAEAGADAIGLNFVAGSPRRIDVRRAREIGDAVRGRLERIAVVADLTDEAISEIAREVEPDMVQLHGAESPDDTQRIMQILDRPVIKAVSLATRDDLAAALLYRVFLIVDARVAGAFGGTGQLADWDLAAELVRQHGNTLLAGGLDPTNVAAAIRTVRPFGVDVASGVEFRDAARKAARGRIDPDRVRAFVAAVRSVD